MSGQGARWRICSQAHIWRCCVSSSPPTHTYFLSPSLSRCFSFFLHQSHQAAPFLQKWSAMSGRNICFFPFNTLICVEFPSARWHPAVGIISDMRHAGFLATDQALCLGNYPPFSLSLSLSLSPSLSFSAQSRSTRDTTSRLIKTSDVHRMRWMLIYPAANIRETYNTTKGQWFEMVVLVS